MVYAFYIPWCISAVISNWNPVSLFCENFRAMSHITNPRVVACFDSLRSRFIMSILSTWRNGHDFWFQKNWPAGPQILSDLLDSSPGHQFCLIVIKPWRRIAFFSTSWSFCRPSWCTTVSFSFCLVVTLCATVFLVAAKPIMTSHCSTALARC